MEVFFGTTLHFMCCPVVLKAEFRCIRWVTDMLCMFSFNPECVYVFMYSSMASHTVYNHMAVDGSVSACVRNCVSACIKRSSCVQAVIGSCVRPLQHACVCLQCGGLPPHQLPGSSVCWDSLSVPSSTLHHTHLTWLPVVLPPPVLVI